MAYKSKPIFNKRVFLNDDKDMTGIGLLYFYREEWDDDPKDGKPKTKHNSVHGSLTLSDCNRLITLELDGGSKRAVKKSLNKLKRIKNLVDTAVKILEDRNNDLKK